MEEEIKTLPALLRSNVMGRPEYWTIERITALCERLDRWSKKDTSISLTEFRADEEISHDIVYQLKLKSNDFARRYDIAKQRLANRISKSMKGAHPQHYNRYISLYDSELQQHDMAMAAAKATAEKQAEESKAEEARKELGEYVKAALSGKSPETKAE